MTFIENIGKKPSRLTNRARRTATFEYQKSVMSYMAMVVQKMTKTRILRQSSFSILPKRVLECIINNKHGFQSNVTGWSRKISLTEAQDEWKYLSIKFDWRHTVNYGSYRIFFSRIILGWELFEIFTHFFLVSTLCTEDLSSRWTWSVLLDFSRKGHVRDAHMNPDQGTETMLYNW